MTNLMEPKGLLCNLLENAARTREIACVKPEQAALAREIAADKNLKVEIYVIPAAPSPAK
jgi:hypothetical protein